MLNENFLFRGRILELYTEGEYPKAALYKLENEKVDEKASLDEERMDLEEKLSKVAGPKFDGKTRREASVDIKKLAKAFEKKALLAPMVERQKLLDNIIGVGPSIAIHPIVEEEKDDIADVIQWDTGKRPNLRKQNTIFLRVFL